MFKNLMAKMEWNDKLSIMGVVVFMVVCELERFYLRKKPDVQSTVANATESEKET